MAVVGVSWGTIRKDIGTEAKDRLYKILYAS